jgi:hypothetical protein
MSVLQKMVLGTRTMQDWVSLAMIEAPVEGMALSGIIEKVKEISGADSPMQVSIAVSNLIGSYIEVVQLILPNHLYSKYRLTHVGMVHASYLWFLDLDFKDEWFTHDVIRMALNREPTILRDVLMDVGASQGIIDACNHPIFSQWLMEMIEVHNE